MYLDIFKNMIFEHDEYPATSSMPPFLTPSIWHRVKKRTLVVIKPNVCDVYYFLNGECMNFDFMISEIKGRSVVADVNVGDIRCATNFWVNNVPHEVLIEPSTFCPIFIMRIRQLDFIYFCSHHEFL
jgi:hypothetical protein